MGGQLDFFIASKDTGFDNDAAIQPFANGEHAWKDTLNRPPENLRTRTEAIRDYVDELMMVARSDRGMQVMSAPDTVLTFKDKGVGEYYFTIDDDLYLVPIVSTAIPAGGSVIQGKYAYVNGGDEFHIVLKDTLKAAAHANNIFFEMVKDAGTPAGTAVVTVEPAEQMPSVGPITIKVTVDDPITTDLDTVITAIKAHVYLAANIIDGALTVVVGGGGANAVIEVARQRLYDSGTDMGVVDPEGIKVSSAEFLTFFGALGATRTMAEGDCLVVDFSTAFDRLDNTTADAMAYPTLRIVSENSINTANGHVVPICKVFNDRLYFANGAVFEEEQAGLLMPDVGLRRNLGVVTVGTDPGADFSTITAALVAVEPLGGIILVQPGTYQENTILNGTGGTTAITLIGSGMPTLQAAGAPGKLLSVTSTTLKRLTISNFTFDEDDNFTSLYVSLDVGALHIEDCVFDSTAAASGTKILDVETKEFRIERCKVTNAGGQDCIAVNYNGADGMSARIVDCSFSDVGKVIYASGFMRQLEIRHNYMDNCGYSPVPATIGALISASATAIISQLSVLRNRMKKTGADPISSGLFIDMSDGATLNGQVQISDNDIQRGLMQDPSGTDEYMITLPDALASKESISVRHNIIWCEHAGGFYGAATDISYNRFYGIDGTTNDSAKGIHLKSTSGVYYGDSTISHNEITWVDKTTDVTTHKGILIEVGVDQSFHVSENSITKLPWGGIGIDVAAPHVSVTGNNVRFRSNAATSGRGILIRSNYCTVVSNSLQYCHEGIEILGGTQNLVNGNRIQATSSAHTGIKCDSANNTIIGNSVKGVGGGTGYGIDCGALTPIGLAANMIIGYAAEAINATAINGVGLTVDGAASNFGNHNHYTTA